MNMFAGANPAQNLLDIGQNVFNNAVSGAAAAAGLNLPSPTNAISSALSTITSPNFDPASAFSSLANLAKIGLTSTNLQNSFSEIDTELRKLEQAAPGAIKAASDLANLGSSIANSKEISGALSNIHPDLGGHIGDFAEHMADGVKQYQDYMSYSDHGSLNPIGFLGRMGNKFQMGQALNGAQDAMDEIVKCLKNP